MADSTQAKLNASCERPAATMSKERAKGDPACQRTTRQSKPIVSDPQIVTDHPRHQCIGLRTQTKDFGKAAETR